MNPNKNQTEYDQEPILDTEDTTATPTPPEDSTGEERMDEYDRRS